MLRSAVVFASAFMAGSVCAGVNTWTGGGPEGGIAWSVQYVSSQPGTAVAITGHAIYRTVDDGANWTAVERDFTPDLVRLYVAAGNPDRVYAVDNNQHQRRSDDAGATFTRISRFGTNDQNFESSLGLSTDGEVLYGGTSGGQIHVSSNGGVTWVERSTGCQRRERHPSLTLQSIRATRRTLTRSSEVCKVRST